MTYTTKLYRRLHELTTWYNRKTHYLRMWLGYARSLQKNRSKYVIPLFCIAFLFFPAVLTLMVLLS